jgi:hypothetical protein
MCIILSNYQYLLLNLIEISDRGGTVTGEKGSKLMLNRVRYCEVWWGSGLGQGTAKSGKLRWVR